MMIAIMILAIVISVDRKKVSVINPVVVTGLNTPRGLTQMDDGSLLIAEVRGGRLLRLSPQ